MTTATFIL